MAQIDITDAARPDLTINPDEAFFILMKAREFDEKVEDADQDDGSNPTDDKALDALEEQGADSTEEELIASIERLNDDAQLDLITLIWIGRGDFSLAEWDEARAAARDIGRERLPRYVCGIPLVSDYLDDALAQLGFALEDYMDVGRPARLP
ncbi:MAG: DUF3775 domain-containing protein [Caulobacterales bacterium]